MRTLIHIALAVASLWLAGCRSAGTHMTFSHPYPEVRRAIQTWCDRLNSPSSDWSEAARLTLSREPLPASRAWISDTNEVPNQSYAVVIWDEFTSFPTAPHMEIRAIRVSPETTRVFVVSEKPSQSSSLITTRRVEQESNTLSQISDILSRQ